MFTTNALICAVVFVVMIALTIIGVPIATSLFASSIAGFLIIGGPKMLMSQLSGAAMALSASYTFAVIPLFIGLGALAGDTGIAGDAFTKLSRAGKPTVLTVG